MARRDNELVPMQALRRFMGLRRREGPCDQENFFCIYQERRKGKARRTNPVPGEHYGVAVDAEERFLVALANAAHDRLIEEGDVYLMSNVIDAIAQEQGAPDAIARHVLRQLDEKGLLMTDDGLFFQGGVGPALFCEKRVERLELWRLTSEMQ